MPKNESIKLVDLLLKAILDLQELMKTMSTNQKKLAEKYFDLEEKYHMLETKMECKKWDS